MTVQEHIVNDMKIAMREKRNDMRDLLRVVMGEFNREGKELSDERAIAIIKKMRDNAVEFKNDAEVTILDLYLPQQMDSETLSIAIKNIISDFDCTSMKDMGRVMSALKFQFGGQYDGKIAGGLVRELLS
jgi:uncharacterized protein YqeY